MCSKEQLRHVPNPQNYTSQNVAVDLQVQVTQRGVFGFGSHTKVGPHYTLRQGENVAAETKHSCDPCAVNVLITCERDLKAYALSTPLNNPLILWTHQAGDGLHNILDTSKRQLHLC